MMPYEERQPKATILLLFILLLGASLRFWGINWGLPYEYQSEEYKVIKYALRMGTGELNPHFFEYPSLYLYFMLFLYGIYYFYCKFIDPFLFPKLFALKFMQDPTPFYLIARGAEAIFGVGVIYLTYYIGRRLVSKKVGLLSGFLIAILPDFVNKAHLAKGDTAAIFLGLLFWIFCLNIYDTGQRKWYLRAGAVLGLAVSTKYYLLFMGIALPLAHFLKPVPRKRSNFIYSLCLVPIFFFLASPYLLIEWRNLLQIISPDFYAGLYSGRESSYFIRLLIASKNMVALSDFDFYFGMDSYGLGFLSLAGLIYFLRKKEKVYYLLTVPILTYWLCISTYHNPAGGYMAPIFPLFLICASILLVRKLEIEKIGTVPIFSRILILALSIISILSSIGASIQRSYHYTLEDSRTIAKKWVEANIPANSKILLDTFINSPPLGMSHEQLERFYYISKEQNLPKKEYFIMKLAVFNKKTPAYNLYLIKRTPAEIGSLKAQVEEVQKTQDLIEIAGTSSDFERLHQEGIEYVIVNSSSESDTFLNHPRLANFYRAIPQKARLLESILPQSPLNPGPAILIYKLSRSDSR